VSGRNGSQIGITEFLTFWKSGDIDGIEHTLSYPDPYDEATEYSMKHIFTPGKYEEGPTRLHVGPAVTLEIDNSGALTAEVYCLQNCGQKGDIDGDGTTDEADLGPMWALVNAIELLGKPTSTPWPPFCADMNEDGVITAEDYTCLHSIFYPPRVCETCQEAVEANNSYSDIEVCNDAIDNNCDGQTDKETYDNSEETFYQIGGDFADLCTCNSKTPCDMLKYINPLGLPRNDEITSESQVYRCAELSYLHPGEYRWYGSDQWECNAEREDASLECGGDTYYCVDGQWTTGSGLNPEEYPLNPLSSGSSSNIQPDDSPFCTGYSDQRVSDPQNELYVYGGDYDGYTPLVGNVDGDGKADLILTRVRGNTHRWWVKKSSDLQGGWPNKYGGGQYIDWGHESGIPALADFDGDGLDDFVIYYTNGTEWYIRFTSGEPGHLSQSPHKRDGGAYVYGWSDMFPAPADFDGDGKADLAGFIRGGSEAGTWRIERSSNGNPHRWNGEGWGLGTDTPAPADFDGDGKADLTVYRGSDGPDWHIKQSINDQKFKWHMIDAIPDFGWAGSLPVPADYAGDGKADLAVYNPSTGCWYIDGCRWQPSN
jgi:hypothetical protein